MKIDVKHIAKLSCLRIEPEKIEKFEREMSGIVEMCENLPELDVSGAIIDVDNVMEMRADIPMASMPREQLLKNVPQQAAGCVLIPKTFE